MALKPDVDDSLPEHEIDAEVAILLHGAKAETAARNLTHQVALGQVGALVRKLRLRTYEDYLPVEAAITKAGGNGVTGGAAAGDQRSGRVFSSWRRRRSDQSRYPPRTTTANA
jgi:hypothetical protein